MNQLLYAIGGFNGYERLRTVEVFDTEVRRWREITPLNNKRSALGACAVNERVYVCGGYDGITSLSTCESFDPCTQQWTMLPPMHRQRSAAGIASIDSRIYSLSPHLWMNSTMQSWAATTACPFFSRSSGTTSTRAPGRRCGR